VRKLLILAIAILLPASSFAVSPEVKKYIKYDSPVIALSHVRLIDGTGGAVKENQTILISGGKIQAAGESSSVTIPKDAMSVDLNGYTVIPGLVGMHDHLFFPAYGNASGGPREALFHEMSSSFPRLYLACGVTTIRTTGSIEPYTDLQLKALVDSGEVPGPKIHISAPYLEGKGAFTPQMHEIKDAADAVKMVNFWADLGATSFKAYMHITSAELKAAAEAAHKRGLKITGHLCSVGFREAASLGIDDLEHGLFVDTEFFSKKKPDDCPSGTDVLKEFTAMDPKSPALKETIQDLIQHHVAVTSTLPVFELLVPGRPPLQQRVLDVMTSDARINYLSLRARMADPAALQARYGSQESPWNDMFRKGMQFEYEFSKAGGLLLAGCDPTGIGGVVAGFGDQREVELLVEAGFTPLEAIHIATANGANFLNEGKRIGTIETGKQADLIVIHGDPAKNINDIENVELVFKDGVGYDSAKLIDSVKGLVGIR